jgi:hypothetical protein
LKNSDILAVFRIVDYLRLASFFSGFFDAIVPCRDYHTGIPKCEIPSDQGDLATEAGHEPLISKAAATCPLGDDIPSMLEAATMCDTF